MEPLLLLRGVREVSLLAKPDAPETVPQRAFDAARARSKAVASLPRAKRIVEQLRMPWREVLVVAHEPEENQNKLLATKTRAATAEDWLTHENVAAVLKLVALRLGADTVSLSEYRVEREKILTADRARWLHGGQLLLPTEEQIMVAVGSWDDALRGAGLRAQRERGPTKRGKAPTLTDLMDRFYDEYGVQPSAGALKEFARGNGIPYPGLRPHNAFKTACEEWREQRRVSGLPEPRVVKRVGGRGIKAPDYSRDLGAARPSERRRDKWSRDDCIAYVARYLAQLDLNERSTSRGYRDWTSAQEIAPVMTTIQRHGGWEAVRRLAQERIGEKPGCSSATELAQRGRVQKAKKTAVSTRFPVGHSKR
jgi:hypothetical protein